MTKVSDFLSGIFKTDIGKLFLLVFGRVVEGGLKDKSVEV